MRPARATVHVGTSGFSYPAWKGHFYPKDLPSSKFLRYYGQHLDTVEINNTFRRMPTEKTVAGWAAQVPSGFRFVLKAPQRITHMLRLKKAAHAVAQFVEVAQTLGERLGPLLFQLPPNFKKDVDRLAAFLPLVPAGCKVAFEFRHESWFADDVYQALRARDAALCIAQEEEREAPFVATASWGYLRLRRPAYGPRKLASWADRVLSQPWTESYVFFKHEEEGKGPVFARRLLDALGKRRPASR
jgi:uncharacterized protein YecE (DUF72 family)